MSEQTVYYNGDILTLVSPLWAQALLVQDGKIAYVGSEVEAFRRTNQHAKRVDLQGKTLMPAFMDAHSHLLSYAKALQSISLQDATSEAEIARRLSAFAKDHPLANHEWITGFGYDPQKLSEHRAPTLAALDRAVPDHPVLVTHQSGHMGVANSAALSLLGITTDTPDPDGGKIGRADGVLTGYLEEMAFTKAAAQIPAPSRESQMHAVLQAQRIYLQHGITTIQEGFAHAEDWSLLHEMADNHSLQADVVCYLDIAKERSFAQKLPRDYFSHLRLGGYKLFLDGSPQGRTAWMTSPYEDSTDGYLGYPIHTDEALHCWVDEALEDGMQLLAHCNGDAAAQQWIDAYRIAREAHPTSADIRPVMIHAQLVRPDQLAQMASLSMIASFFVQHVYHFGDTHVQNFGLSRAEKISPTRSAIENGVCYTFHQDTPVLPPDMLESIWCATQRITRSGRVLGACERITAWEALLAVTRNAAYQYAEETRKGTLAVGKLADLVILDQNPLCIAPQEIRNIRVMETIKEGQTVYLA